MKKECTNCHNYKIEPGAMMKHKCKAYVQYTVFGFLDGTVCPECYQFSPIHVDKTHGKSLREATLIRAGGTWSQQKKQIHENADIHVWYCQSCGAAMQRYGTFCDKCKPKTYTRKDKKHDK